MGKLGVLPDSVINKDTVGMNQYYHLSILQQKP